MAAGGGTGRGRRGTSGIARVGRRESVEPDAGPVADATSSRDGGIDVPLAVDTKSARGQRNGRYWRRDRGRNRWDCDGWHDDGRSRRDRDGWERGLSAGGRTRLWLTRHRLGMAGLTFRSRPTLVCRWTSEPGALMAQGRATGGGAPAREALAREAPAQAVPAQAALARAARPGQ